MAGLTQFIHKGGVMMRVQLVHGMFDAVYPYKWGDDESTSSTWYV